MASTHAVLIKQDKLKLNQFSIRIIILKITIISNRGRLSETHSLDFNNSYKLAIFKVNLLVSKLSIVHRVKS